MSRYVSNFLLFIYLFLNKHPVNIITLKIEDISFEYYSSLNNAFKTVAILEKSMLLNF
jgi:hypothetical protein